MVLPEVRISGTHLVAMKTREAGLWNRIPGWEKETTRRRHAPWDANWDPDFSRRALNAVMSETSAHNAVISLGRPEDLPLILGDD